MRDCQLSWRCELRVSPHSCLAMRWAPHALCAAVVELTLCSIKCVEAVAACAESQNRLPSLHCVCFSAGLRALISGAEIWQAQQVMTEAVVRSHPEPQRRLTFQADEGLVQYTEHKSADQWSLMMPLF